MVVVTIAAHLFPVSPLLGLRLWPQFCLTLCFVSGVKSVNTHTHTHTHKRLRYLPKCQINPSNLSWPAFLQHRKHTVAVTKDENLGHVNTVEIHGPEKQAPLSSDDGRRWWPTIDIVTEVVFFLFRALRVSTRLRLSYCTHMDVSATPLCILCYANTVVTS